MLRDYLLVNWDKLVGTAIPSSLQVVPISSCLYEYGNDLVLIFVNNHKYPDYVMKISRNMKYGFKIKNEFSALSSLRTVEKLSRHIPVPYYIGNCDKRIFLPWQME